MKFPLLDRALWAAGFLEQFALLIVLIVRGRWRTFPTFTAWVGFEISSSALVYAIYRFASPHQYAFTYWCAQIVDLSLQTAVVFEMARIVLKPTGTWVRDARRMFLLLGLAGAVLAVGVAFAVNPTMPNSLETWIEKANFFSIMLILELFVSMGLASTQLGLVWRNHIMGLATGLAVWAVVDFFVEGAYSHWGPIWHGIVLDRIRILVYLAAVIYWIIIFWLPEPENRTLSPEMQSYLSALRKQMELSVRDVSSIEKR